MKRGDTGGLSTVITTVIVILLVIVAIGIVWGVLRNMISKNAELITLGKFTIDLEIVSVTQNSYGTNIKVKRNPGEGDLEGIIFSIFDGEETHVFEKTDIDLDQLEVKTFTVIYYGDIVSVSVYPMFSTESGRSTMGDLADTYYDSGSGLGGGGGYVDPNCIPSCTGKVCGDDGCGGVCPPGCSGGTPYCVSGICQAGTGGLDPSCLCALTTCIGTTCDDGLGGTCWGLELADCTNEFGYTIDCGPSENGCGNCAECGSGYHCFEGTCQPDCTGDCTGKECGDNGCGASCGECSLIGPSWVCNSSFKCEVCQPNCTGKNCGGDGCGGSCGDCNELLGQTCNETSGICILCTPNCLGRECGDNECGGSCGNCSELYPGFPEDSCTTEGVCYVETVKNIGTVYSFWPSPEGRMLFDSEDLPISPLIDYTGYYVKFPGSAEDGICMRIYDFVTPINPLVYDKTYMKISEDPTLIDVGDDYEVWETYSACCRNYC